MDNLKELVYIVNRNKVKRIDMLDLSTSSPSKVNQLYQGISSGEIDTDVAAFQVLFPTAKSKSAYRNLKVVLRDKLLNTLFFIDAYQSGYSDRQTAFYEAYKDFAAAQMLLAKNARKAGIQLLERLLKKVDHFEFLELSLAINRLLRLHYGTRLGDEKKYHLYNDKWTDCHQLSELENKAEQYYSELVLHYVNNKSTKAELQTQAKKYYQTLATDIPHSASYKFRFYTTLVQLFQYTCTNNYPAAIPICKEAIRFFEEKPFAANTPIQICLHHQLVAYMQLRDFEKGAKIARQSQKLIEEGSFNWFKNFEYLFLLAMHTANYQQAYEVLQEAVHHKRYKFLPDQIQEMWQLYEAYVHLLIEFGEILPSTNQKKSSVFRIQRFLNNMPLYSKDKRGMNIAIFVVQILFYIQQKKYDIAIDRMEAIEKYCSRYLFKEDTMRSYYFIKLLLCIPRAGFHSTAVERYAKQPLKKLKNISSEMSNQFHKIEIIPYEILWDIAFGMLDTKMIKLKKLKAFQLKTS